MCLRYELDAIKILEIQTVPLIETGRLIGTISILEIDQVF